LFTNLENLKKHSNNFIKTSKGVAKSLKITYFIALFINYFKLLD